MLAIFWWPSLWTVKKIMSAIIRPSQKNSGIRKAFSCMKGCSQQRTVERFRACGVLQPSFGRSLFKPTDTPALFCWRSPRNNTLSLLEPARVLCVRSNIGLGSLFLAAHRHLQSWLRSVAGISPLYALPPHSCLEGDIRSLWPQGILCVPQSPRSQLLAIQPLCSPLLQCLQMRESSCSYCRALKISI